MTPPSILARASAPLALGLAAAAPAAAQWSQAQLSAPRSGLSATSVGHLALFAGGYALSDVVDVYDESTGLWSTAQLSAPKSYLGAASSGSKAYFGGGIDATGMFSAIVDVFDASTGTWSTLQLPTVRGKTVATAVAGLVLFCDGVAVDLLDVASGTWSSTSLSVYRGELCATSHGDVAFFAGGSLGQSSCSALQSDLVDVFDAATGSWSVAHLSVARSSVAATTVGGKTLFAGGYSPTCGLWPLGYGVVDVFDHATGSWTVTQLPPARRLRPAATRVGDRAIFADGDVADVYDAATGQWSTYPLSVPRERMGATSVGTRAIFAGGAVCTGGGLAPLVCTAQSAVDVYDDAIGTGYCTPATPNSTGDAGRLSVLGFPGAVSQGFVHLAASSLPAGSTGYFLASRAQASVANPGGSQGTLCLGGSIGRFVGPGQVQAADAGGRISLSVDLASLPQPTGAVAATASEAWNFQAWYRDANPVPTSNFTDAVAVMFQ